MGANCLHCGEAFPAKTNKRGRPRMFCNETCRYRWHASQTAKERFCDECGLRFLTNQPHQRTCGRAECKKARAASYYRDWYARSGRSRKKPVSGSSGASRGA